MSTETKTEELRGRLEAAIDKTRVEWPVPEVVDWILDNVIAVLRADPSAVIAALGGTQPWNAWRGWSGEWRGCAEAGGRIVPVWVLGEQP